MVRRTCGSATQPRDDSILCPSGYTGEQRDSSPGLNGCHGLPTPKGGLGLSLDSKTNSAALSAAAKRAVEGVGSAVAHHQHGSEARSPAAQPIRLQKWPSLAGTRRSPSREDVAPILESTSMIGRRGTTGKALVLGLVQVALHSEQPIPRLSRGGVSTELHLGNRPIFGLSWNLILH